MLLSAPNCYVLFILRHTLLFFFSFFFFLSDNRWKLDILKITFNKRPFTLVLGEAIKKLITLDALSTLGFHTLL